ncbi:hypothetical protein B0H12DRAFT_190662 [Mycena haematopus]|nr:hypothetical protein B0H12DRAFT_190662 [Mycena haematopus]
MECRSRRLHRALCTLGQNFLPHDIVDRTDAVYSTKYGTYKPHCGLDTVCSRGGTMKRTLVSVFYSVYLIPQEQPSSLKKASVRSGTTALPLSLTSLFVIWYPSLCLADIMSPAIGDASGDKALAVVPALNPYCTTGIVQL